MIARHTAIPLIVTLAALAASGPAAARSWTPAQLQSLSAAYSARNPGWVSPLASDARTPAQTTWTTKNLDALAQAYGALNPAWAPR